MPETRAEILQGELLWSLPADAPHATKHLDLAYVLAAHVASGYRGAIDMLTRTSLNDDFAPDASVFPADPDPQTGGRRLEELVFEITSEQALAVPTRKARQLVARGVRRVFAILVKQNRVLEWDRPTDGWSPLVGRAEITDRCLVRPLSIRALLEATEQDNEVARALLTKGNVVLAEHIAQERQRGHEAGQEEGLREAICTACKLLLIPLSEEKQSALNTMSKAALVTLLGHLRTERKWPEAVVR